MLTRPDKTIELRRDKIDLFVRHKDEDYSSYRINLTSTH